MLSKAGTGEVSNVSFIYVSDLISNEGRKRCMPKKSLSENPDTLDYILNSLKENSDDLNTLIKEVSKIADRISDICELSSFKRVEEKINMLQNDIKTLTESSRAVHPENQIPTFDAESKGQKGGSPEIPEKSNPLTVLGCKSWKDFQTFAATAQTVHFSYQESDKIFEAEALKDNKIVAYGGEIPMLALLLKLWLTGQLDTPEGKVFEGSLTKA